MRILLLADLHSCRSWYEWLTAQASQYDLVAIAGDLIDMFGHDEQCQIDWLRSVWLPQFRDQRVPLAVCSGNHDLGAHAWLGYINTLEEIVGDGVTQLVTLGSVQKLIVTTLPNNRWAGDALMIRLWEEGARLRAAEKCPWLVLHHEPPSLLCATDDLTASRWLDLRLNQYHPDIVACGHLHITGDLSFGVKIGPTWCFNAGQWTGAPRPHHIVLDLSARTATRHWMAPLRGTLSWFSKSETLAL